MWNRSENDEYEKNAVRENIVATVLFLLCVFAIAALMGLLGFEVDASKFVR